MKNIVILENRSEIGAGTRGSSLGIDALKVAALDYMSNLFVQLPREEIKNENQLLYQPIESPFGKRIKGVASMYERIAKMVSETISSNFFPIILSGDHSSAGGTIAGLKMAKPKERLGVIWIDAHSDLHTPYTTPSGNMHGMPVAASLGIDNLEQKHNEIDSSTKSAWEKMKNVGKISPKINPEDVVFIGLRDYEKEEEALIKKHKMKVITVAEIRKKGIEQISKTIKQYLNKCDQVYISFDVDSIDSSVSKGTGTPVPNGLKEREAQDLLANLVQFHKLSCLEITEINPTLDRENMMAELAFNILQRSVNQLMVS